MKLKSVSRRTIYQLFSFALIGVAGFVVDTSVLYAAIFVGLGLYVGRAVSYLAAVTFSWAFNSRYTFKKHDVANRFVQWRRFLISQLSGATINLGVYAALIRASRYCGQHPVIGVAVGSLAGLLVNFIAARLYVFER
jgi:putative flippase GtrA